jgi:hypothetical protein
MKLLCLNNIVPQMLRAPHKFYMLEFDHTKGELAMFSLFPVQVLKTLDEFKDITDKTTVNKIGVEGDKGGHLHGNIKSTHALVVDFRPLGIYILYWEKATSQKALGAALRSRYFARISKAAAAAQKAAPKTGRRRSR